MVSVYYIKILVGKTLVNHSLQSFGEEKLGEFAGKTLADLSFNHFSY